VVGEVNEEIEVRIFTLLFLTLSLIESLLVEAQANATFCACIGEAPGHCLEEDY
jgi:hypothetical protein